MKMLKDPKSLNYKELAKEINVLIGDQKDYDDNSLNLPDDTLIELIDDVDGILQLLNVDRPLTQREKEMIKSDLLHLRDETHDPKIRAKIIKALNALDAGDLHELKRLLESIKDDFRNAIKELNQDYIADERNKYDELAYNLKQLAQKVHDAIENDGKFEAQELEDIDEQLLNIWNTIIENECDDPRFKDKRPEDVKVRSIPVDVFLREMLQEVKDLNGFIMKLLREQKPPTEIVIESIKETPISTAREQEDELEEGNMIEDLEWSRQNSFDNEMKKNYQTDTEITVDQIAQFESPGQFYQILQNSNSDIETAQTAIEKYLNELWEDNFDDQEKLKNLMNDLISYLKDRN